MTKKKDLLMKLQREKDLVEDTYKSDYKNQNRRQELKLNILKTESRIEEMEKKEMMDKLERMHIDSSKYELHYWHHTGTDMDCPYCRIESDRIPDEPINPNQYMRHYYDNHQGEHLDCSYCQYGNQSTHKSMCSDTDDRRIGRLCKLWNCRDNRQSLGYPNKVIRQQFLGGDYKIVGFMTPDGKRWDKAEVDKKNYR